MRKISRFGARSASMLTLIALLQVAVVLGGCSTNGTPVFNPGGSLSQSMYQSPQDATLNRELDDTQPATDQLADRNSRANESAAGSADRQLGKPSGDLASASANSVVQPSTIAPRSDASMLRRMSSEFTQLTRTSMPGLVEPPASNGGSQIVMRSQSADYGWGNQYQGSPNQGGGQTGPGGYSRGRQPLNDATGQGGSVQQTTYQEVIPGQGNRVQVPPDAGFGPVLPGNTEPYARGPYGNQGYLPGEAVDEYGLPANFADIDVFVQEAQSGRFMIGAGFNSDAGVTGQLIVDERNFDILRPPTSFDEIVDGRAWRGAGQGFRLEAMPGSEVQRYLVSFSEPYLPYTQISMNVSGYYYDRNFFDWDEQRLGGRLAFGYRLTPDLSLTAATRMEQVKIYNPRTLASPELNAALGESDLLIGQLTLTHDTRDHPFAPTEGHLIELSYSQAFGTYDYPRADLDYRKYLLINERPDGSGRHTMSFSTQLGFSGSQTPVFENYFAGGVTSLRGFDFRGAVPISGGVRIGGPFRWVNSVEYLFPITADDMIKGVAFCDFGTVESGVRLDADNFRVAPGIGLRVSVPNFGGAPLAFDLAFPVARADGDDIRNFSFFMGLLR